MARAVIQVALRRKHAMFPASRLRPFQIDQLRHEKLRQRLLNLVIRIHREHAKGSGRIVAAVLHLQRQIMEVIQAVAAGVQKRADIIGQPKTGEKIHVRLARSR